MGEEVVLELTQALAGSFAEVYFDNFFNSPKLIDELFKRGTYSTGTVRSNRKNMPRLPEDNKMERGIGIGTVSYTHLTLPTILRV